MAITGFKKGSGHFAVDISAMVKKSNANTIDIIHKIIFDTFSRLVLRTPVKTGRMRANWQVSINSPVVNPGGTQKTDKPGSATLREGNATIGSFEGDGSVFITNNVEYAGIIEYGREDGSPGSLQAPGGVVRITIEEMAGFLARANVATLKSMTGVNQ